MKSRIAHLVCIATVLTGCSRIPDLPDRAEVQPSDVTRYAECQIRAAVLPLVYKDGTIYRPNEWLSRWSAAAELTLVGGRTAAIGTGLTWTIPAVAPNALSFAPSVSISDTRTRTATVSFEFPILDLVRRTGRNVPAITHLCENPGNGDGPGRRPILAGDIGIAEWIRDVVVAANIDDAAATPSGFGHVIEFGITRKAGVKPEFAVVNLSGNIDPGLELVQTVKLAITFTFDEESPGLYGLLRQGAGRPRAMPPAARSSQGSRVGAEAQIRLREQLRGLSLQNLQTLPRSIR